MRRVTSASCLICLWAILATFLQYVIYFFSSFVYGAFDYSVGFILQCYVVRKYHCDSPDQSTLHPFQPRLIRATQAALGSHVMYFKKKMVNINSDLYCACYNTCKDRWRITSSDDGRMMKTKMIMIIPYILAYKPTIFN